MAVGSDRRQPREDQGCGIPGTGADSQSSASRRLARLHINSPIGPILLLVRRYEGDGVLAANVMSNLFTNRENVLQSLGEKCLSAGSI